MDWYKFNELSILKKLPTITIHMAVDGEKFVSHLRKDDRVTNLPVVLITTDQLVKKELLLNET